MKENLFRAWDEKTKKMYYVEKEKDIVFALSPFGIIAIDIKNNKKLNHLKYMQYLNHNDVENKKIYECDIVQNENDGTIGIVYYDEAETSYIVHLKIDENGNEIEEYEVVGLSGGWRRIGNIYEHAHLLESKKSLT